MKHNIRSHLLVVLLALLSSACEDKLASEVSESTEKIESADLSPAEIDPNACTTTKSAALPFSESTTENNDRRLDADQIVFSSESNIVVAVGATEVVNHQEHAWTTVFRSADTGATWSAAARFENLYEPELFSHQKSGQIVLVGRRTDGARWFKLAKESTDGGKTWKNLTPFDGMSASKIFTRFAPNGDLLVLAYKNTPDDFGNPKDSWTLQRRSAAKGSWTILNRYDSRVSKNFRDPFGLLASDIGAAILWGIPEGAALPDETSEAGVAFVKPEIGVRYSIDGKSWTETTLWTDSHHSEDIIPGFGAFGRISHAHGADVIPVFPFLHSMPAIKLIKFSSSGLSYEDYTEYIPGTTLSEVLMPFGDEFLFRTNGVVLPNGEILFNSFTNDVTRTVNLRKRNQFSKTQIADRKTRAVSDIHVAYRSGFSIGGKIASLNASAPRPDSPKIEDWHIVVSDCAKR